MIVLLNSPRKKNVLFKVSCFASSTFNLAFFKESSGQSVAETSEFMVGQSVENISRFDSCNEIEVAFLFLFFFLNYVFN